jgi:hypothetical protein
VVIYRVETLQLDPSVRCGELPINFFCAVIPFSIPCRHFNPHGFNVGNPAIDALPFQNAEFNLCYIPFPISSQRLKE